MSGYSSVLAITILSIPMLLLKSAAFQPVEYRLFPRRQFAQLRFVTRCFTAVGAAIGVTAVGHIMEWLPRNPIGAVTPITIESVRSEPQYHYVYLFEALFQLLAFAAFLITYLYWKKHGGSNFHYEVERQPSPEKAFPVIPSPPTG
jgi:hypothetical protein